MTGLPWGDDGQMNRRAKQNTSKQTKPKQTWTSNRVECMISESLSATPALHSRSYWATNSEARLILLSQRWSELKGVMSQVHLPDHYRPFSYQSWITALNWRATSRLTLPWLQHSFSAWSLVSWHKGSSSFCWEIVWVGLQIIAANLHLSMQIHYYFWSLEVALCLTH